MVDLAPPDAASRDAPSPGAGRLLPAARRAPVSTARRAAGRLRREPVAIRFDRREAAAAAGLYLAVAGIGFAVLLLLSHHLGYGVQHVLKRWDSGNYLSVAQHGYPSRLSYLPDGTPRWSTLAFFPLLPALIRAVHLATALPYPLAGAAVSWPAAAVAAAGVHTLVRSLYGRRAGYAAVGLWACSPYAFALWVPYSEALFSAVLIWALIALLARRWVAAGLLTAAAGAIRPTASVLVGVVVLAALGQIVRDRAARGEAAAPGRLRPWLALLLAPLGLAFSWLFLGSEVGRLDGWFEAERAWGQSFDFGRGTLQFITMVATYRHIDLRYPVVLAVIVLVAVAVAAGALDRRVPWPLVLALAGAWELMVGTPGSPLSKPRFMLPFLPLMLLPAARAAAGLPRLVQGLLYAGGALFAGWYAVGLLLVFRWSP